MKTSPTVMRWMMAGSPVSAEFLMDCFSSPETSDWSEVKQKIPLEPTFLTVHFRRRPPIPVLALCPIIPLAGEEANAELPEPILDGIMGGAEKVKFIQALLGIRDDDYTHSQYASEARPLV